MAEFKCGFPENEDDMKRGPNQWKDPKYKTPCGELCLESDYALIDLPNGSQQLKVYLCNYHILTMMKMFQRDITELIKNEQLTGTIQDLRSENE